MVGLPAYANAEHKVAGVACAGAHKEAACDVVHARKERLRLLAGNIAVIPGMSLQLRRDAQLVCRALFFAHIGKFYARRRREAGCVGRRPLRLPLADKVLVDLHDILPAQIFVHKRFCRLWLGCAHLYERVEFTQGLIVTVFQLGSMHGQADARQPRVER